MPKSPKAGLSHDLDEMLEDVTVHLKRATEAVGDEAEETLSKASVVLTRAAHALAEQVKQRSAQIAASAAHEVKAHPIATAAAIAAAAAALAGMVVAARRPRAG